MWIWLVGGELHNTCLRHTNPPDTQQQRPPKELLSFCFIRGAPPPFFLLCHWTLIAMGTQLGRICDIRVQDKLGPRHFLILFSRLFRIVNFDCYSTLNVCAFFVVCVLCVYVPCVNRVVFGCVIVCVCVWHVPMVHGRRVQHDVNMISLMTSWL